MDGWLGLEPSCIITKKCVQQIIKVTSKCTNERRKFFSFRFGAKAIFQPASPLWKNFPSRFSLVKTELSGWIARETWNGRTEQWISAVFGSSSRQLMSQNVKIFSDESIDRVENTFPSFYRFSTGPQWVSGAGGDTAFISAWTVFTESWEHSDYDEESAEPTCDGEREELLRRGRKEVAREKREFSVIKAHISRFQVNFSPVRGVKIVKTVKNNPQQEFKIKIHSRKKRSERRKEKKLCKSPFTPVHIVEGTRTHTLTHMCEKHRPTSS